MSGIFVILTLLWRQDTVVVEIALAIKLKYSVQRLRRIEFNYEADSTTQS